jgi:hypothetical protein
MPPGWSVMPYISAKPEILAPRWPSNRRCPPNGLGRWTAPPVRARRPHKPETRGEQRTRNAAVPQRSSPTTQQSGTSSAFRGDSAPTSPPSRTGIKAQPVITRLTRTERPNRTPRTGPVRSR